MGLTFPVETDISEISTVERHPPGTRLVRSTGDVCRYGRAATRLRAGKRVYMGLEEHERPEGNVITEEIQRKVYSRLSSRAKKGWLLLGFAVVDVPEGCFCWVRTKL